MKKLIFVFALAASFAVQAFAQNLTTVSASNIQDLNGTKLAAGQLCFQGTDQSDNPIAFGIGGGGQALKRQYCSPVTAGVVTSFTVPNPANTNPTGIYYRVRVVDSSTGQEVLRYTGVTFAGATFNFDNYTPIIQGASLALLTGTSVSGNLSVTGNVAATGTVTGSNIPATSCSRSSMQAWDLRSGRLSTVWPGWFAPTMPELHARMYAWDRLPRLPSAQRRHSMPARRRASN